MTNDKDRESILKAVKERVKQSEELQLTQMIVDAIGERRYRDLGDLVSEIEQDRGWNAAIKHLTAARRFSYTLPIGAGPNKVQVEHLKYREMVFTLLGCSGYEPINLSTEEILSRLVKAESLIHASQILQAECESLVRNQIESGECLFFNPEYAVNSISKDIADILEQAQQEAITNLVLEKHEDTINVLPLWYNEKGRQVLSQLGIKGYEIDLETFDIVISVLHQELSTTESLEVISTRTPLVPPSNSLYEILLLSIINHEIENLSEMSSMQSYYTLEFILKDALDQYEKQPSSENFRIFLSLVSIHVRVRTPESIILLEELAHSKDTRIATTAITALGNFYTESAASALVDLLCTTKNREIADTSVRAIKNVSNSCFETKYILKTATESTTCTNPGQVKRLYKEIWTKKDDYYL
ncbi:HEAT repeat domain-containing protein [Candidatus Thorarchaeota archaeon]|nr:MAG: HEAT repeat domain-containing protein [Candidatus Thorarchaeota archaeon]